MEILANARLKIFANTILSGDDPILKTLDIMKNELSKDGKLSKKFFNSFNKLEKWSFENGKYFNSVSKYSIDDLMARIENHSEYVDDEDENIVEHLRSMEKIIDFIHERITKMKRR